MTWLITAHGAEYHIHPHTTHLNNHGIHEIAHALAQINRFTGHASRPYSVAEHSLLVAQIAESTGASPAIQLAALMHDAHEAYVGDMASPIKWTVGEAWQVLEDHHATNLRREYNLLSTYAGHRADLKHWDLMALATERRDLLKWSPAIDRPWPILDAPGLEVPAWTGQRLDTPAREAASWQHWRDAFLAKFNNLQGKLTCPPNSPSA